MKKHQYINNPSVLLAQGKSIVSENADNKYVYRVSMVNLMLGGIPPKTLASYCGESERVLQSWLKKVDEEGWASLMAVKQNGRPSRLSPEQIKAIKEDVCGDPEKYGYHNWDGPALSDHIRQCYGVEYGVRACQNLMHRMGLSRSRPQSYPSQENPDGAERGEFKNN